MAAGQVLDIFGLLKELSEFETGFLHVATVWAEKQKEKNVKRMLKLRNKQAFKADHLNKNKRNFWGAKKDF